MNTKDVGNKTEAIILSELIKNGYTVSIPFGENSRYDIIADDGRQLYRIQCKTGRIRNGCIVFSNYRMNKLSGKNVKIQYSKDDIDFLMVYSPDLNKIYIISLEETVKGEKSIRFKKPKRGGNQKTIKWAKDFEFNGEVS